MAESQSTALPPLEERPLVTFALFAYNQEKYIREAIEGAFAQTYEPLEIILSDDCSTDRTFEIMEEMARHYNGAHVVKVRKSEKNISLWHHIRDVVAESRGQYIVLAAGDDISLSNRTEQSVRFLRKHCADVMFSGFQKINGAGEVVEKHCYLNPSEHWVWNYLRVEGRHSIPIVHGATATYSRVFLQNAIKSIPFAISSEGFVFAEDTLLSVFALATNIPIIRFDEQPLVKYRIGPNSLSNTELSDRTKVDHRKKVLREIFASRAMHSLLLCINEIGVNVGEFNQKINHNALAAGILKSKVESCVAMGFVARLKTGYEVGNSRLLLIWLPRLLGINALIKIRALRDAISNRATFYPR